MTEEKDLKNSDIRNSEKKNRSEKGSKFFVAKIIIVLIILIALALFLVFNITKEKRTAAVVVESILMDEKIMSELSTLIVPYGGVYEGMENNKKEIIAYKGTVTYGLDLFKIEIIESGEKEILVKIPEVSLTNVHIDPKSVSSMPEGKINNLQERLKKCEEDLKNKFYDVSDEMSILANESAKETIYNFLKPVVDVMGDGYTIKVE